MRTELRSLLFWPAVILAAMVCLGSAQAAEAPRGNANANEDEFGNSMFPRQLGLENRWQTFRARTNDASLRTLEQLLEESASGSGLVPGKGPLFTAIWEEINRFLIGQSPNEQALLRQAQDRKAVELGITGPGLEPPSLLASFRRLPWAATFHQALLDFGEKTLEEGNSGLALRTFQDVLTHTASAELRAKAQAGLWLALANETDDPEVLQAAFKDVSPQAQFPWLGEQRAAAAIKQQLLAGLKPAETETGVTLLAQLSVQVLRGPPYSPWTFRGFQRNRDEVLPHFPSAFGELQTRAGFTLLSGPNLLVGFGDDPAQPLWARIPPPQPVLKKRRERDSHALPVPGPFRPAIGQDTVFTRWGFDASQQYLTGLAAFSRDTGEMLWSTENDLDWQELWPASDPTLAEGSVYVLALREGAAAMSPYWLMCLNPVNGKLRWKRVLASSDVGIERGRNAPNLPKNQIDLAHYGNAVTVRRGAVFCATQMGLVARCDVRDGMVDWVYPYPRVSLGTNLYEVMQRQGAAPALSGNAVIFFPRDAAGLFALDAESGQLLWENVSIRARALVGVQGGLVLVHNESEVVALKAMTGEVAWEKRFDEPIVGEPQFAGTSVLLGTRRGLHRLDAATGKTVEERKWDSAEPVRQFVMTASNLFLWRDDSTAVDKPAKTAGAETLTRPLTLPLAQVLDLPGDHPVLWVPPPEARLTNTVFCHAEGVLRCVRAGPAVEVVWQRLLRPGFRRPVWGNDLLLVPTRMSVLAVKASTGVALWETTLPFEVVEAQVCGEFLFVANLRQESKSPEAAALRLTTGEVVWQHALPLTVFGDRREQGIPFAWDGARLHIFAKAPRAGNELRDFVVEIKDGAVLETRPLLKDAQLHRLKIAAGRSAAFFCNAKGEVFEYGFADGKLTPYPGLTYMSGEDAVREFRFSDPWVIAHTRVRGGKENERQIQIRKWGDPTFKFELRTTGTGQIRGHNLLVFHANERLVESTDLLTRAETRFQAPAPTEKNSKGQVLDFRLGTESCWMLSGDRRDGERMPSIMRVDLFNPATGAHLGGQRLRELDTWTVAGENDDEEWWSRPQPAAWTERVLFCADRLGLHGFTGAPPGEKTERTMRFAQRMEVPLVVDGKLDDWKGHASTELRGPEPGTGQVFLAHNETTLFIGVRYADAFAMPSAGDTTAGDHLEIGVSGARNRFRACVSMEPSRGVNWSVLSGEFPRGSKAAMHHDAIRRELAYELAIPIRNIVGEKVESRKLEVAVVVWDDRPGRSGPPRRLSWSGGSGSELTRADYEPVYLDPFTPAGAGAARAIVEALPELPESMDLLSEWWAARRETPEAQLAFGRELIKKNPRSLAAERLLYLLDASTRPENDPSARVLAVAAEAGVPAPVLERYRRQPQTNFPSAIFPEDRPYLSQWVRLDPADPPTSLVVSLHHDSGHQFHAVWGEPVGQGRSMGPLPQAGEWSQLRLPLHWAGFEALPIQTLAFGQAGGKVVWDRTSVVVAGREQVVIENDTPPLRADRRRREWQPWVTNHVGNTWAVAGRVGDALYCDGRTGYAEVPHSPAIDPTNLTVEAWVYLEVYPLGGENRRWVVNKNSNESQEGHYGLALRGTKAGVYFNIGNHDAGKAELWSAEGSIQLRHWHHLAMTYDSAVLRFYLDGQAVTNFPINKVRVPGKHPLHLGRRQDGYVYCDGAMDEVRIYNRALSAEEIKTSFELPGTVGKDAQTAHRGFDGEAAPANPATNWQWVTEPVKLGKKARLQTAGQGHASHYAPLREPITVHLPFDPTNAIAILKTHLPQLGPTDHAYRFLEALMRLSGADPTNKIAAYEWFARALPNHPRMPDALGRLMQEFERAGDPAPRQAVTDLLAGAGIPARTRYHYGRRYAYPYRPLIREWQILGPFANEDGQGLDTPYAPEFDGVQLAKKAPGAFEEIAWQKLESKWNHIDLGSVYGPLEKVVAYAACWVHSDQDRAATLIAGSDESCKVWINRALALRATNTAEARVSETIVPIQLKQGWNEVLVKLTQLGGSWGFELDLADANLSSPPADLKFSAVPLE